MVFRPMILTCWYDSWYHLDCHISVKCTGTGITDGNACTGILLVSDLVPATHDFYQVT